MKLSLIILSILLCSTAWARTDCPAAKIENIQIEGGFILYNQEGANWRRLGKLNEEGTAERYSAMLAAQMSGKRVMVAYSRNDYDCSVSNTSESAHIVRTYNN